MKEQLNEIIGQRLRAARKAKGWSLDITANQTGVSKAMLGQIERGESNPTISTLWKIAVGLEQSFSSLITNDSDIGQVADSMLSHFPESEGVDFEVIFPYQDDVAMETYQLTMQPYYEHQANAHTPGVIEHIVVKQGTLNVWFNQQWHSVCAGQSIRFNADQPHAYVNSTDALVIFYDIICYSQQGKQS
jgi:transcriptional regulator with XRE-family HTH domain